MRNLDGRSMKERITLIHNFLEEHIKTKGYALGVRAICYALEATGIIKANTADEKIRLFNAYERANREGRRNRQIPVEWVADASGRETIFPSYGFGRMWDYIDMKLSTSSYKRDWRDYQENYIEMVVEKKGLIPFYESICKKYRIPLTPVGGDASISFCHELGERLQSMQDKGKTCYVLYCGDFNWMGFSIEKSMEKNITHFSSHKTVNIKRVGLTVDHIKKYTNLPFNPNPAKGKGEKTKKQRFLEMCIANDIREDKNIELDALTVYYPAEHLTEVTNTILSLIDDDGIKQWEQDSETDRKWMDAKFAGLREELFKERTKNNKGGKR